MSGIDSYKNRERPPVVYTARFVSDMPGLLNLFTPKHKNIFGHHSTIAFKPLTLDGIEIGAKSKMKITGRVHDEKGDALLVENDKSLFPHPHITLSCAENTPPIYSNEMITRAVANNSVDYFPEPFEIDVVEGYSDGKIDVTWKA